MREGFPVSRTYFRAVSTVSGDVVGENTAHAMEALGGREMAENKSLLERSMDGGCRASAAEPELPGEVAGGFDVIESDRGQLCSWEMCRRGMQGEPSVT